jgi:hypothetical protein
MKIADWIDGATGHLRVENDLLQFTICRLPPPSSVPRPPLVTRLELARDIRLHYWEGSWRIETGADNLNAFLSFLVARNLVVTNFAEIKQLASMYAQMTRKMNLLPIHWKDAATGISTPYAYMSRGSYTLTGQGPAAFYIVFPGHGRLEIGGDLAQLMTDYLHQIGISTEEYC